MSRTNFLLDDETDSELASPETKDTLAVHGEILQERYDIVAKMRLQHQIQHENPFRPEGEVSREANEIVDAIQSGNFQKIYSPSDSIGAR